MDKEWVTWIVLKRTDELLLALTQCSVHAFTFSTSSCLPLKWTRGTPPPSRSWSSSAATPSAKWRWKLGTWNGPRWCALSTSTTTTGPCRPLWSWKTSTGFSVLERGSRPVRLGAWSRRWWPGSRQAAHSREPSVCSCGSGRGWGQVQCQLLRVLAGAVLKSCPWSPRRLSSAAAWRDVERWGSRLLTPVLAERLCFHVDSAAGK